MIKARTKNVIEEGMKDERWRMDDQKEIEDCRVKEKRKTQTWMTEIKGRDADVNFTVVCHL